MLLKLIGAIVVAIVILFGGAWFLGSRLPVAHVATRTVMIPAAPDAVFATITDFATMPSWRADLERVEVDSTVQGRVRFTEVSAAGPMTVEVVERTPPRRLVTRIVGEGLPYGGAWAYAVEPDGGGSRVTITEHGEVYNPLFRFVSRYVMGHATTLESYLAALGRRYGIEAVPVDAAPVPLT